MGRKSPKEEIYVYIWMAYSLLLYSGNGHIIVKQLYFNKNLKYKKETNIKTKSILEFRSREVMKDTPSQWLTSTKI